NFSPGRYAHDSSDECVKLQPRAEKIRVSGLLVFRSGVAGTARTATSEMNIVLVRTSGALRQQTPVGRRSMNPRQPVFRRLRTVAVGIFCAKTAARRRLDSSSGFNCAHSFLSLQIILRPLGRDPFFRQPA